MQIANVTHTRTTLTEAQPKLGINVDQVQAQRVGMEPLTIATQLDAALTGVTGGSIMTGMRDIPVRVRLPIEDQGDLSRLSSLEIVRADLLDSEGLHDPEVGWPCLGGSGDMRNFSASRLRTRTLKLE